MSYREKNTNMSTANQKAGVCVNFKRSGSIFQRLAHISENLEANPFDNSYFNNNAYHYGTTLRFTIALQCGSFLVQVYNFSQRLRGLA